MNQYVRGALMAWSVLAALGMPAPAGEPRSADAVGVFHCTFGKEWDENYDLWPDRWVRKTGPAYPHYVDIELSGDAAAERWLQIDLDGAAAAVASPPIRVMSRFSYKLEVKLKNEQLQNSTVVITLDFYDAAGRLLQSVKSAPVGSTDGWRAVQLDEIEPTDPAIDRAVVGLEVIRGPLKGDLQGRVSLKDVWLERRPRISVTTNNTFNVYTGLNDVAVKCELSGIRERNPEIQFQLLDVTNNVCDGGSFPLNGRLINETANQGAAVVDGVGRSPAGFEGSTEWRPKIPNYGYYHVVVKMLSSETPGATEADRELHKSRTIWLVVLPPLEMDMPKRGEFGWSLPNGDAPHFLDNLSHLLPQVGINWVKLPAWYDANNARRGDELIRFVELLGASNIEVVGLIDRPPADTELAARVTADTPIAALLSPDASAAWSPVLEPVMTRLSLRVRWWQLGRDFDTSFAGDADVNKRIAELRTQLFRFGQDVRLGLCWDWDAEKQVKDNVTWDFQQLCLATPASQKKLDGLFAKPHENSASHWVLVEPPPRGDASNENSEQAAGQFREFVMKLVSAKVHGADGIFVPNPFNDENGIMRANGMPAEILLPWRTTAAMLGGAKFLGSMQLPGGSENRIFIRPDDKLVMVVWNNKATREKLYLGKKIRQFDIFGFATTPPLDNGEQVIDVGPQPTFVLGLHEAITRLRMTLAFEHEQIPSVYSRPHPNALRFHNYFSQGVGGSVSIVVPKEEHAESSGSDVTTGEATSPVFERFTIDPPRGAFKLAKSEDTRFPFEIRLKDATFGKQPVRIEFSVEGDEHYQFSVYRELEVGTGDLTLHVTTHLDDDGALVVEQFMTNLANNLADFKCDLYGGPRRQRMQVYRLGKELDKQVYRFPNGKDLIGREMSLEIEELNGGERVIRHPFIVSDTPSEENGDAAAASPAKDDSTGGVARKSFTEQKVGT